MNKLTAYLYREAGAQGVATHWSSAALENQSPYQYEFLGLGEWVRGKSSLCLLADHVPLAQHMERVQP